MGDSVNEWGDFLLAKPESICRWFCHASGGFIYHLLQNMHTMFDCDLSNRLGHTSLVVMLTTACSMYGA